MIIFKKKDEYKKKCFVISTNYEKQIANTETPCIPLQLLAKIGHIFFIFLKWLLMFSHAIAVFSVPIQEKRNKCQTSTVQVLYVIYECNVLNVFPPVWCFMKGGRICYNYKSCPPLNGCHF